MNFLLKKLMSNPYTKKKANLVLIILCSILLRNLLYYLTYFLIRSGHDFFDFILSVFITIFLTTNTSFIDHFVTKYQFILTPLTSYFIDNIFKKYRLWTKWLVFIGVPLFMLFVYFNDIGSSWLIYTGLHFVICFFILDKIEDWNTYHSWTGSLHSWFNQKINKVHITQFQPFPSLNNSYSSIPLNHPNFKMNSSTPDITELHLTQTTPSILNELADNPDIHSKFKTLNNVENINTSEIKPNYSDYP